MNTRLAGLAAVAAVLAGYVAWQGFGPDTPGDDAGVTPPVAVAARSSAVKLNPLEGSDPASYPAIVEKPLFNPTRLPRPDAPPPPPPAPPEQPVVEEPPPPPPPAGPGPQDYRLLGVSAGPDGRIAALRIAASGDVVYLRKGESIDSWSIVDVGDRSVQIGSVDNPVTFGLFEGGSEATPPAAGEGLPVSQPPLPLPLPMQRPQTQPGEPPMPEQHSLPGG